MVTISNVSPIYSLLVALQLATKTKAVVARSRPLLTPPKPPCHVDYTRRLHAPEEPLMGDQETPALWTSLYLT